MPIAPHNVVIESDGIAFTLSATDSNNLLAKR
jgi:hypothetical protein